MKYFLAGCFAGLCLVVGLLITVQSGVAVHDRDWGYFSALAVAAACFLIGGWLILYNGMELYQE